MAAIQKLALVFALLFHTICSATKVDKKDFITARQVSRGSLQQVTSFGSNPTNVGFYIYVPNNLASNPGIIVAIHECTASAQAYYSGSPYAPTYAEQYGFIVIYPSSPYSGTCWDVSSTSALTHNGGGDSNSIANMVTWTISEYNADASKVFVTGSSSGAMMTNVMAATYPELFAAGTVYSGVAAGCFMSNSNQVDGWNSSCAQGDVIATPQYWGTVAENMYPGYTGSRPKMQIYHGTADTILYPPNFNETCKQWADVFGYNYNSPQQVISNDPQSEYYTYIWGPNLQGIYAIGVGHTVPIHGPQDMEWFGFAGGSTSTTSATSTSTTTTSASTTRTTSSTTTTTTSSTTTTTTGTSGCTQAHWGQCGGIGWAGCTVCASPYTCQVSNPYYSQCL